MIKKRLQHFYIIDKKKLTNDIENSCDCSCVCSTLYSGGGQTLSTILDNAQKFDFDQTSLYKAIHARLHYTRWPNALDISLYMNVGRCIVKGRERLARALELLPLNSNTRQLK